MKTVFEGIRVIDFTSNMAGPNCSALLGDFGAEVIKVERPVVGDDSRLGFPQLEPGQSVITQWANRSKKSIVLALNDPRSVRIIKHLVKGADVVIESFMPGTMKKFGLDYDALKEVNPGIIYCSVSGYGQSGKYSNRAGFDIIAQAMSGLMDITGSPDGLPTRCGTVVGDYVGSLNAFGAIVTALYHKLNTGEGQYIDIGLLDGLIAINPFIEQAANINNHPTRSGDHYRNVAPYGLYRGSNGQYVIIGAYTDGTWKRLCDAIGRPELANDEKLGTNNSRLANMPLLIETIEDWLKRFEDIEDALKILTDNNVPACKIASTDDVVADPAYWERGNLIELPLAPSVKSRKTMKARGPWMRLSKTPAEMKRAPMLGEHTYEILRECGMTVDEIDSCQKEWNEQFKNLKK